MRLQQAGMVVTGARKRMCYRTTAFALALTRCLFQLVLHGTVFVNSVCLSSVQMSLRVGDVLSLAPVYIQR